MRTTLKRGILQSAALNGDGAGGLPDGALSVIRRYRQPERARSPLRLLGRILLAVAAALLMVIAALGGGAYLFFHQSINAVRAHTKDVKVAQKYLHAPPPGKPAVALVVGYDLRYDEDGYGRSDTLMLVRADPATKSISMLSFPRDLKVLVRCPGKEWVDKINAAYANCGAKGAVLTMRALTGLSINYLIKVDFRGFRQIVDRLGGVWIDVDHRYFNNNAGLGPGYTYDRINLKPGYQRLNGAQALSFVRFRHTDSDLFRNARQQQFVKAVKEQIENSFSPITDLPKIINSITNNVEVGRGGGAPLNETEVVRYALFAYQMPPGHFFQAKIDNLAEESGSTFYLTAPESAIAAGVRDFANPDVEAPEKAEEAVLGRRAGTRKLRPAAVSVSVVNGNRVAGSAALARRLLGERGYQTTEPANPLAANAPTQDYWHTTVYFDPGKEKAKDGARLIANEFGDAVTVRGIPQQLERLADGAMTLVAVGKTFHGNLAPAPIDRTPKKQPPQVRRDVAETMHLLRKRRHRVPFPLMVPTRVERDSELASSGRSPVPIRVYSLARHIGVRLVFQMPNGIDFWGIEETNWTDAPILQRPSTTRFVRGRRYDLYFSGPHLHMVVLRTDEATYWVVNSLTDALSNETMLAIAKGLRPLAKPHKPKAKKQRPQKPTRTKRKQ